jgi:hypothetical protein
MLRAVLHAGALSVVSHSVAWFRASLGSILLLDLAVVTAARL